MFVLLLVHSSVTFVFKLIMPLLSSAPHLNPGLYPHLYLVSSSCLALVPVFCYCICSVCGSASLFVFRHGQFL